MCSVVWPVFVTDTAAGTHNNTVRKRASKETISFHGSDNKLGRVSSQWRIYDKFILFLFVNAHVSFVRVQTNAYCKQRSAHNIEKKIWYLPVSVLFLRHMGCVFYYLYDFWIEGGPSSAVSVYLFCDMYTSVVYRRHILVVYITLSSPPWICLCRVPYI